MIQSFHHIALLASEEEASLRFYGVLGFAPGERYVRPDRGDIVLMLRSGDMTLELFIQPGHPARLSQPEAFGLRHLALRTDDAEAVYAALQKAGYAPEEMRTDAFTGKKMFFIKDPDGQPLEIHE